MRRLATAGADLPSLSYGHLVGDSTGTARRGKHNPLASPQLRRAGGRSCDTRCTLFLAMTAKEKLLQRAPHWSEEQAERALRAAESDEAVDEWGDLSKAA